MLVALFSVLFAVLLGGTDTPFVIPDADKLIKKSVTDKGRRDEALSVVDDYKTEWKALQKVKKGQAKTLEKYVKSYGTSKENFVALFTEARDQRSSFNVKLSESRYKLQDMLTNEEWKTLMQAAEEKIAKNDKKLEKADLKQLLRKNKRLVKIGESIETAFEKEEDQQKATDLLTQFEDAIISLLYENQSYRNGIVETLYNQNATLEELTAITEKVEDWRTETQNSYVDLYLGLVELSSEKEWSKLSKQLIKFIE